MGVEPAEEIVPNPVVELKLIIEDEVFRVRCLMFVRSPLEFIL